MSDIDLDALPVRVAPGSVPVGLGLVQRRDASQPGDSCRRVENTATGPFGANELWPQAKTIDARRPHAGSRW